MVILDASTLKNSDLNCSGRSAIQHTRAAVVTRSANHLTIKTHPDQPAWLVVNESWGAGWHASVDGHDEPLLRGDYAMRAIRVSPGNHVVSMTYRPRYFALSAAFAILATAIAAISLLCFGVRRLHLARRLVVVAVQRRHVR
jgi:uncharacterized membrane protein YfhO